MQTMRFPDPPPDHGPRPPRILILMAVMGPGVLGLAADNDAGGMLSYVVTGASRHLLWFIPALLVMAPITYLIQELALRVAIATRTPFARLISRHFGSKLALANGLVLHSLNLLTLISEFMGMALALSWFGVPWLVGVSLSLLLVLLVTRLKNYVTVERLMLGFSALTFAFIPIALMLNVTVPRIRAALGSVHMAPSIPFLLLALVGNAVAPWMIYWQQNATWAGQPQTLRRGRADIRLGIAVQMIMAVSALWIGALAAGAHPLTSIPIANITRIAGPVGRLLFSVGLFDAGFLAAVTIGLSSSWMLRELLAPSGPLERPRTPTEGRAGLIHALSLGLAAAIVSIPNLSPAAIALWAQAASGLLMPITLFFLAYLASRTDEMGLMHMHLRRALVFFAVIAGFVGLGIWTISTLF